LQPKKSSNGKVSLGSKRGTKRKGPSKQQMKDRAFIIERTKRMVSERADLIMKETTAKRRFRPAIYDI